jgi:Mrp family chromosome partitioning ATPase
MSAKEDIFDPMDSVLQSFTADAGGSSERWRSKRDPAEASEILDSRLPKGRDHDEMLQLVQRLFLAPAPMSTKSVMFCGIDTDHSSHVCANAGRILARQTGATVCLVDANVQLGQLSRHFDLEQKYAIYGKWVPWREQIAYVSKNLFVGGTGLLGGSGGRLAAASEIRDRIRTLASSFDYVLFDAPGANTSSDAPLLGQVVGSAVLVFEPKSTKKTEAKKAKERLETVNVRILGAVLNNYL